MLRMLIGDDNVAGPTLASLSTQFGLSSLLSKTLAVLSDVRLGRADPAEVVEKLLAISGEDKITADIKHRSATHHQFSVRFLLLSNELPRLSDASGTIVSRFILLRTTQSFFGREDAELTDKLAGELPGIFLWAAEGLRRHRERGKFVQPKSGKEGLDQMTNLASPVMAFVKDCCQLTPKGLCPKQTLYMAYKTWCAAEGIEYKLAAETFGRDLMSAYYPAIKDARPRNDQGGRERCYTGITLIENFNDVPGLELSLHQWFRGLHE